VSFFIEKTKGSEDMGSKGSRLANILAWEYDKRKRYEEKRKQREKEQEEQKRKERK